MTKRRLFSVKGATMIKNRFTHSCGTAAVGFIALVIAAAAGVPTGLLGVLGNPNPLVAQPLAGPAYTDWSAPVNLGPIVNSAFDDNHPHISKDGLSLFFHSTRPGGYGSEDIWVSHRSSLDAEWELPQNLGPNINSPSRDRVPFLMPGEKWLLFGSDRPGGFGGIDLWVARRKDKRDDLNSWEPAINVGGGINTASDDDGAAVFENDDGRFVLYFASNRPGGLGDFDIYQAVQQPNGSFGAPTLVAGINSVGRDTRTAITRDGLELFITSNRPGSAQLDIWTAGRKSTDDDWSALTRLPLALVNSSNNDGAPALTFDRKTLFFYSNRPGGYGGNDLYMTTRTRVHGKGR